MALVAPLAAVESADYIRLVLTLTFLVGLMQLLLGLARVGALIEKVPHAVVVGFTAGAALLIFNSQLAPLLGLSVPRGASVFNNLQHLLHQLPALNPLALTSGAATLVLAVLARPFTRIVPSMLAAVVGGSLCAMALAARLPQWPALAMVSALPGPLPPLSWPDLRVDTVRSLFGATLVLTLLALTEAGAIARAVARRSGDTLDGNQEFIGQGLANLAGAFFSALPSSGSFNRSGVNAESGARTPLAAASAALFLVLILSFVAPLARYLPLAVVAGLLFVVAWGLIDGAEMRRIWREDRLERAPLLVTLVATVTLSLEWAILLGITSALIARRLVR